MAAKQPLYSAQSQLPQQAGTTDSNLDLVLPALCSNSTACGYSEISTFVSQILLEPLPSLRHKVPRAGNVPRRPGKARKLRSWGKEA